MLHISSIGGIATSCARTADSQNQSVPSLGLGIVAVSVSCGLAVIWQKVWTLPSQSFPVGYRS